MHNINILEYESGQACMDRHARKLQLPRFAEAYNHNAVILVLAYI